MAIAHGDGRVLLCVRREAMETPAVADALRDRWGVDSFVLDPSSFPGSSHLTLEYSSSRTFQGHWARELLGKERILAIWQGAFVGAELPAMDPGIRETCIAASEIAIAGLLDGLQAFQLEPYWTFARVDNKPHQLRVAQALGLDIPETIVSNDASKVRAFAGRHASLIMKALVQQVNVRPVEDGERSIIFTTAMTAADLENLDGLELCPMIFQEQIPNELEVRATVVGKRIFAAAVDKAARGGDVDWRRHGYVADVIPGWSPYELPDEVGIRLLKMMDHFGLNFGAADFIVTPEGRHVFLELNAFGSFFFLGPHFTKLISEAIADVLMDPSARRIANHA